MYYSSIMYVFVQLLIVISYLVLCAILTNHRTCCNCCGSLFAVSCCTSANFPTTMGWCSWSCSSHRRAMALRAINVQFGCRICVDSEPFFCDSQKACPGTTKVPSRQTQQPYNSTTLHSPTTTAAPFAPRIFGPLPVAEKDRLQPRSGAMVWEKIPDLIF